MSIFTLILLLIIGYWLVRSLKGLFIDAFGSGTARRQNTSSFNPFSNRGANPSGNQNGRARPNANGPQNGGSGPQRNSSGPQSSHSHDYTDHPIAKGEGEYVDFEEV